MWRTVTQLTDQHRQHQRAMARWEAIRATLPDRVTSATGGLTICSVAFRAKACLEVADVLMRRLNPGAPRPQWLVFDNNTEPGELVARDDPRFTVTRGERDVTMGYEHALGISALLSQVRSRFLLIQDPDCFIVTPDWLRWVPKYMDDRRLGFFGTPMNPRRHNSYQNFPYMTCLFVDLARVPVRDLCFLPGVWEWRANVAYRTRKALADIPKIGSLFRWLLTEQWRTNGWRIKAQYGDGRAVPFECVQPVWDVGAAVPRQGLKRLVHTLTPASVSPIPKKSGFCSPRGFAAMGAPDVGALGWEEFVWRDRPFAFHIGSIHLPAKNGYPARLADVIDAFAQQTAGAA